MWLLVSKFVRTQAQMILIGWIENLTTSMTVAQAKMTIGQTGYSHLSFTLDHSLLLLICSTCLAWSWLVFAHILCCNLPHSRNRLSLFWLAEPSLRTSSWLLTWHDLAGSTCFSCTSSLTSSWTSSFRTFTWSFHSHLPACECSRTKRAEKPSTPCCTL